MCGNWPESGRRVRAVSWRRLWSIEGQAGHAAVAVLPDDVRVHDIRRTVADGLLNRIGVSPWIVDHVVLGHGRPKLLRIYMPKLPLGEARDALQRWAEELERILDSAANLEGSAVEWASSSEGVGW